MRLRALPILVLLYGWAAPVAQAGPPSCPQGLGASAGDAPRQVFALGEAGTVLLCGWAERSEAGLPQYSEFELVEAGSGNLLLRFAAEDTATVEQQGAALQVIEQRRLPIGEDFSWQDVPYRRFTLRAEGGQWHTACELAFARPRFSAAELREIAHRYAAAQQGEPPGEELPLLVVLAATGGDAAATARLPRAATELRLDGHLAEVFSAALQDLAELRTGHCVLEEPTWMAPAGQAVGARAP